jgi:hypothetical protein
MFRVYSVSYDLRTKGQPDYQGLIEELQGSPGWWHHLESTWLVATEETPDALWARLEPHVHQRDYVLIIEVRNYSQGWLPRQAWDWINSFVPTYPPALAA